MRDLTTGNKWVLSKNRFLNRKYMMQEMYQNYVEDLEWDVPPEKDPFMEASETETMIGSVHVYLQSLGYNIEVVEQLAITDYRGFEQGHLEVRFSLISIAYSL
jgi:hypothetical protein